MHDFILQLALMISFGVVVYLFAVATPRVGEEETSPSKNFLRKWAQEVPLDRVDKSVNTFFEKALRKFKVFIMKIDNVVTKHLNNVKQNGNGSNGNGNGHSELQK